MSPGRRLVGLVFVISMLTACSLSSSQPPTPTASTSGPSVASSPSAAKSRSTRAATAPTWAPGDRWTYAWTSGKDGGRKTVEVREIRELNGALYYVVRNAGADHYWTRDIHWVGTVRDSKPETRMDPPEPWFSWPLEPGRQWQHRGEFAQADGKRSVAEDVFVVVGTEAVEVPAGTFQAFRITRTGRGGDTDEYWYVPEVRSYARWIGRRLDGQGNVIQFEERLAEYRAAPTLPPPGEPPRVPSSLR